jgi:exoribonuclease II
MPRPEDLAYLQTIPDDEPVFIVRAQDKFAMDTVADWIRRAKQFAVNEVKIARVMKHLDAISAFWGANPGRVKLPD